MFEMITVVTVLLANVDHRHEVGRLSHQMHFEDLEACQFVEERIGQTIEDSFRTTAQGMYETLFEEIPVRLESFTTCSIRRE